MVPIIPKQRQHKAGASKRFNALIQYLQGELEQSKQSQLGMEPAQTLGGRESQSSDFSELLDYATAPVDTKLKGEKCIAIRTHGVSNIETAPLEMNAVSRKNRRCEDPVYHFILSWPEHEKPAPAAIFDAAEHAIKSLGLQEHQYVIAVHANTDNIHCHVAVNRVHPTTFRSHHIEWAKRTLHYAARESEIKHGWSHDNGIYIVQTDGQGRKQIALNTKHVDANQEVPHEAHPEVEHDAPLPTWHDPQSLESWLKSTVSKRLKEDLPSLSSWQALHVWLDGFGITLKDAGGGGLRLRAASLETGETLDIAASKGLRALRRPELEKRWGAFAPPFINPVVTPDFSHLTQQQLIQGVERVLRSSPDRGVPPPHQLAALEAALAERRREEAIPGAAGRLHELPDRGLATGEQVAPVLLQDDVHDGMGHEQAGHDSRLRRPSESGRSGSRRGDGSVSRQEPPDGPPGVTEQGRARPAVEVGPTEPGGRLSAEPGALDPREAIGRRPRDPAARARRKAERAAARADLRRRFSQYRSLVAGGDAEYFLGLRQLRTDRAQELKEIRAEEKGAAAIAMRTADRAVRLVALAAFNAEAARRRAEVHARHRLRQTELRASRVPPLAWREWLVEQSNLGDRAALSALRGIVYQARRDAALPAAPAGEMEDVDLAAADYHALQHRRLMARLREEEKRELAIRAASVHEMRPHQADALLIAYAGLQWHVTGNGNVEYSRAGLHVFTDRGSRVTFDRMKVDDESIQLALVHARAKFGGRLTLTGADPVFVERMARFADDMGIGILNPELQPLLAEHRARRAGADLGRHAATEAAAGQQQASDRAVLASDETSTSPGSTAVRNEAAPRDPEGELRAAVAAIDPRATFERVDATEATGAGRIFVGPVVATASGQHPMFAQHLGRGVYGLHQGVPSRDTGDDVVEVRYTAGRADVRPRGRGPDRGR
jgi:hypothetical protein